MNLKQKLFISIGSLLLFLGVAFYLSFFLFFKNDLQETKIELESLFAQQSQKGLEEDFLSLKERLSTVKKQIDTLFLSPDGITSQKKNWANLSSFLFSHPNVNFIQYHNLEDGTVKALVPSTAHFHAVTTLAMNDHFFFVLLPSYKKSEEKNIFFAFPVSTSSTLSCPCYLLFSWKEMESEVKSFFTALEKITKLPLQSQMEEKEELEKLTMLNILAPFYDEGAEIFSNGVKKIPSGIAILSPDGKGKALLSSEIFYEKALFDDKTYYDNNRPSASSKAIAQSTAIINASDETFIGNTFKGNDYFLTLGFSLSPFLRELSSHMHRDLILSDDNGSIGFFSDGKEMTCEEIEQFLQGKKGEFKILSNLTVYVPYRVENTLAFLSFDNLTKNLTNKLSLQMILLIICLLILALLILNYFSKYITKPLEELVETTKLVKEGKYKSIVFPNLRNRRDEIAALSSSFQEMVLELKDKERMRSLLNKVVSKDIAEEILKNEVHLGGEDKIVTILFADIRNFTEITQNLPPQKTVHMLNVMMTKISKIIEGEGGVIDKYVGDEVMALFGAPISASDHALRALSSAKIMVETLRHWNKEREEQGEPVLEIGIGINTGLVVAGNMGAEDRLNYTVVGPSVNLASRLCKIAKASQVIISEFTLEEPNIKDSFYVESLPPVVLKGFSEPVKSFQVTGFKWDNL